MGQLVFQATLGGQVNLVGPNTASTLNINVPAFAGTMASLASVTTNGVNYVNSSGQPTSGSAFVFDGTNVGIGTASPAQKLHISGTGDTRLQVESTSSGAGVIYLNGSTAGFAGYNTIQSRNSSTVQWAIGGSGDQNTLPFYTNGSERMRIDSSGNVGIGRTSPTARLHLSTASGNTALTLSTNNNDSANATLYNDATYFGIGTNFGTTGVKVRFALNTPDNAMTLDSSGNLLIGSTSGSLDGFAEKLFVSQNSANAAFIASNTNSSCISPAIIGVTADRNTTNNTFYPISYYNRGAANYKFRVADSGNVTNTNNSYGQTSDIKLKENIVDATQKLEKLNQVRVVNFNFIGDQQKQLGVIAQELEQVFPGMVEESVDRDAEGNDLGTTTKSVKYSVFVPMLIKAIQEQQAIITSMTDRITALEAK